MAAYDAAGAGREAASVFVAGSRTRSNRISSAIFLTNGRAVLDGVLHVAALRRVVMKRVVSSGTIPSIRLRTAGHGAAIAGVQMARLVVRILMAFVILALAVSPYVEATARTQDAGRGRLAILSGAASAVLGGRAIDALGPPTAAAATVTAVGSAG